jgi:hypothetical protein
MQKYHVNITLYLHFGYKKNTIAKAWRLLMLNPADCIFVVNFTFTPFMYKKGVLVYAGYRFVKERLFLHYYDFFCT